MRNSERGRGALGAGGGAVTNGALFLTLAVADSCARRGALESHAWRAGAGCVQVEEFKATAAMTEEKLSGDMSSKLEQQKQRHEVEMEKLRDEASAAMQRLQARRPL